MMRRYFLLFVAAGLVGCTTPSIDDTKWRCNAHEDCGSGWLCHESTHTCTLADTGGTNGVFADRLVIGMVGPLEAASAGEVRIGQSLRNGIQAYFKHANDSGGIKGRKLELRSLDDGGDPDQALRQAQKLGNDGVLALLGSVGNVTTTVLADWASDEGKLLFGPAAGGDALRAGDPPDRYVFFYRASDAQEIEKLVNYLVDKRIPPVPAENIALFSEANDQGQLNAQGRSALEGMKAVLKASYGVEETPAVGTYMRGSAEVAEAVAAVLRWLGSGRLVASGGASPSAAVLVHASYGAARAFVKDLYDAFYDIKKGKTTADLTSSEVERIKEVFEVAVVATSSVGGNVFAAELAALGSLETDNRGTRRKYCEDMILSQVVPSPTASASGILRYLDDLAAYDPNIVPCYVSLEGYLTARLLGKALEEHSYDLSLESLIDEIESLGTIDLGIGADLVFNGTRHQASTTVWGSRTDAECMLEPLDLEAAGGDVVDPTACEADLCVLSGTISADATLKSDKVWQLEGKVFVGTENIPVVLQIEAGTKIIGDTATRGMLIVSRGSKIKAAGTRDRPIIFTSAEAEGSRDRGNWGGLIINGKARINCADGGTCESDGEGASGTYGGADDADDSGELRYVRIEFAGAQLVGEHRTPGLWLRGVGSGTTIDYVQVNRALGDGVAVVGGAVNLKHLQSTSSGSNGIRWTEGWHGKGQFIVVRQAGDVYSNAAIEGLGNPAAPNATPRSRPTLYNVTLVGKSTVSYGLRLADGTRLEMHDAIIDTFDTSCVDIDGAETWGNDATPVDGLVLEDSIINCTTLTTPGESDPDPEDVLTYLQANNRDIDPLLVNPYKEVPIDMRPQAGSPALTGAITPPDDGFFDTSVTYVGALDVDDEWNLTWTTDEHK